MHLVVSDILDSEKDGSTCSVNIHKIKLLPRTFKFSAIIQTLLYWKCNKPYKYLFDSFTIHLYFLGINLVNEHIKEGYFFLHER